MAVEVDVENSRLRILPGMFAEVRWPVRNTRPSLLVPPSSIVTTTEQTFVVRVKNEVAEWVTVSRGAALGNLVEVQGALKPGELVVRRGTDELRPGARFQIQPAQQPQ